MGDSKYTVGWIIWTPWGGIWGMPHRTRVEAINDYCACNDHESYNEARLRAKEGDVWPTQKSTLSPAVRRFWRKERRRGFMAVWCSIEVSDYRTNEARDD